MDKLSQRGDKDRESSDGTILRERLAGIVEGLYDIGKVTAVWEIFGGYNSRSFGVEVVRDGHPRTFYVRKYKRGVAAAEIQFEHALIRHAIQNGFTICAGVVAGTKGKTFVRPADSRSMFAVYDFLGGEDKYTWDHQDLTDAEFESAGRVLANFHNAVCDFDPGGLQRAEPPILSLWPRLAHNFERAARHSCSGKFNAQYASNHQSLQDTIACNPLDPADTEALAVIPIHCDYHPGNLKWTDERVVGIFDFDWSKMDLRLFDVGLAVIYFCCRWGQPHDGQLRPDKCGLFLRAYQHRLQELAGLEALTAAEQKLLPKMMKIANIYLAHWVVSDYRKTTGADDGEYLVYFNHCLRLMHWLDRHQATLEETIYGAITR